GSKRARPRVPAVGTTGRGRPYGRRRPRARTGGERGGGGRWAASRAGGGGAERGAARRCGRGRGRGRPGRLPRASFGAGAQLPVPDPAAPDAVTVRAAAELVVSAAARRGGAREGRSARRRRARLPGLHADGDAARGVRPHRERG